MFLPTTNEATEFIYDRTEFPLDDIERHRTIDTERFEG